MLIAEALDPITDDDQIDAFTNKLGGKPVCIL
jgi:hypothetical protein